MEQYRNDCAYYQCSLCGHVTQIIKFVGMVEVYDEEGNYLGETEAYELDGEASFNAVVEHEEEEHGIK
ncbi:hypothetical protein Q5O89_16795 [Peribacillus frigoritolerans]|nr:hypothetical protein [Peribacillus frigoritolerans]